MKQTDLENILKKAVHTPSGDNAQPWRFRVERNGIKIYNIVGKDATLYNFEERGSIFAHGSLIENIKISAAEHNLKVDIKIFPEPNNKQYTAEVIVAGGNNRGDALTNFIIERSTNRKPYQKIRLKKEDRDELLKAVADFQVGEIRLQEDPQSIRKLAQNISLNERLILESKPIHDFLFGILKWTSEEEEREGGLYIKTLEFSKPQEALFKKLKNWRLVRVLNFLGFPKLVSKQSAELYANSGAIGVLLIPNENADNFLRAGMVFQRFWLTATKLGISLQPITALPYLAQRIKAGKGEALSKFHQTLIMKNYDNIKKIFNIDDQTVAMLFRIGYSEPPSAKSAKLPPRINVA